MRTPLADVAEKADWAAVTRSLADAGETDLNVAQVDGMTALHWAVWHDETDVARALIAAGADVRAANRYGVTPLSIACANGNAAVVEALLAAGADAGETRVGGETALMTAARTGNPGCVQALIVHGADPNAPGPRDQTALMWAAAEGNVEAARLLIRAGADINAKLASGFTPMFFAVRAGEIDTVKLLLKAGVDINAVMEPQKTSRRSPVPGMSAFLLAVENGHYELALELAKAGADLNDQRSGFTALHNITWIRKPDHGDDVEPPAIGRGNVGSLQFVEAIVKLGADVNARLEKAKPPRKAQVNLLGATPFFLAAKRVDLPLMKLLLELGADPSITNVDGTTPLMMAAGLGAGSNADEAGTEDEAVEVIDWLVSLGADVNAIDTNSETALHGAAYRSFPKVAAALAAHGADPALWNQQNKYGWTPLHIAQGYRPGNFKPSAATIEAISAIMLAAGIDPASVPRPEMVSEY